MCAGLLAVPSQHGRACSRRAPDAGRGASGKIPAERLDSLVAPIALYPDPLLSQTLVASTYPLEIVQLQQWLGEEQGAQGQSAGRRWSSKQPGIRASRRMVALPDVVNRLADDIQWTTELGNAFLAQQSDVMDAVQRMRKKAQGTGALGVERTAEGGNQGRREQDR